METLGVTLRMQRQFDTGFRDDDEIVRAAEDFATEAVERLDAAHRNELTDILETGVELWEALEALGVVRIYRETSDLCSCLECVETNAVRQRCHPDAIIPPATLAYLMRASVQADKRGSRSGSSSAKKKSSGRHVSEPTIVTSYGWKLPAAS